MDYIVHYYHNSKQYHNSSWLTMTTVNKSSIPIPKPIATWNISTGLGIAELSCITSTTALLYVYHCDDSVVNQSTMKSQEVWFICFTIH